MSNIIEIKDLHFSYEANSEKPVEILKGINLNIREGEFVAVLGHNGSGKSTLAKHINAILAPTSGKVLVDGIDTADEAKIFDLRQRAGMVFQNPDNQIVSSIVEEDVAFALENLGVPYEEMRRRVDDALKAVNMYDYRLHSPAQLSGGQKQRVAIAGIIAMRPKCIILDEPTAMLDPQGRREVMSVIRKMNAEGVTIVLITHYMDEAAQCGRVVVMDKGRVVLDDTPRAVFSHVAEIKKIGLDVPQVTELAWELKKAGIDISTEIITEQECVEALKKLLIK
ncbi:MAG: energy-coupling factor transporter ATPase [Ruminococcus flavefaciens]|nr:energy-coupling factor transporter ATPase [Ruminococcus flavefaciens]MCM1229417.1 energy-coupling factor transporter ATPase [Ruminococcus flavefaciens]